MRLLRTAAGGYINAATIVRLADGGDDGWIAVLDGGEEVALASYYSAPGRVERDLPELVPMSAPAAGCVSDACCSKGLAG